MWTNGENIRIGPNEFINWLDWDTDKLKVLDIDHLIDAQNEFWQSLQSECLPECCGLHAFDWTTENVRKAYSNCNEKEIKEILRDAIATLESSPENVVCSTMINQLFEKSVFIKLLKHLTSLVPSLPEGDLEH